MSSNYNKIAAPQGVVEIVIDTDAYNEIDDQYALAYAIRSTNKICIEALYAAPFSNARAATPEEGMEKSYHEIRKVLTLMGEEQLIERVFYGSRNYLASETSFQESEAARDLVERSKGRAFGNPLYVVAIGAITNIASAILMDPTVVDRIVLVWLGGHAHHWPDTREFNMIQDIAAARVVFNSKVPLVQLPCMGVVQNLSTSKPELTYWLKEQNPLCDYLLEYTTNVAEEESQNNPCWSRVLWDVAAIAWLLDTHFTETTVVQTPLPTYDGVYDFNQAIRPITYVYCIHRDNIMADLMRKLTTQEIIDV